MRASVTVRPATSGDISALLGLWMQAQDNWRRGERSRLAQAPAEVAARLEELVEGPDVEVLVAAAGAEPVGMTMLEPTALGALSELSTLQMSYTVVSHQHRRRGVGRALVAAATAYAEERGLSSVLVDVPPGLRDAHRFYARLGFAPAVTRRSAPVSLLRRRLATPARRLTVDDLVRLRSRPRPGMAARSRLGLDADRPTGRSRPARPARPA